MTEYERWNLLRDAVRIRWSKIAAREDEKNSPEQAALLKMGIAVYKDVLRIINQIEGLGR